MKKERITITLSKDLLEKVDSSIDGAELRNRSHAVEYYLSKGLGSPVGKALILAGEKKIRFHRLARRIPKTMIPVDGKPVAEHLVAWLKDNGFKRIIFGIGYKKEKLESHFRDGSKLGVEIIYSEAKGRGTAGTLLHARDYLSGGVFVVTDGDILTRFDLKEMVKFHEKNNALVTVALKSVARPSSPVVELEGSRIIRFIEKPGKEVHSNLINAGVYVMNPKVFDRAKNESSIKKDLLPVIAGENGLYGYPFSGPWIEIGGPDSIKKAEEIW